MNLKKSVLLIAIFIITIVSAGIFNSGCYLGDDETRVTIRLQRNDLGMNYYIPEKRMIDRVLEFFSTPGYAGGWVDERNNMVLSIISTSFDDIIINLPSGATSFTTTVPSASNVTFRITAEGDRIGDGIQKMWRREKVISLTPGDLEISISMIQMTWITGASGSTEMNVSWYSNPSYVIAYKIYRSLNEFGNYEYLGTVNYPSTSFQDFSALLGVTYYYRVRTVSSYGEGVMSDPVSGTRE